MHQSIKWSFTALVGLVFLLISSSFLLGRPDEQVGEAVGASPIAPTGLEVQPKRNSIRPGEVRRQVVEQPGPLEQWLLSESRLHHVRCAVDGGMDEAGLLAASEILEPRKSASEMLVFRRTAEGQTIVGGGTEFWRLDWSPTECSLKRLVGGVVFGVVRDGEGSRIADSAVRVCGVQGRTDEAGEFRLFVPPERGLRPDPLGYFCPAVAWKQGAGAALGESALVLDKDEVELDLTLQAVEFDVGIYDTYVEGTTDPEEAMQQERELYFRPLLEIAPPALHEEILDLLEGPNGP